MSDDFEVNSTGTFNLVEQQAKEIERLSAEVSRLKQELAGHQFITGRLMENQRDDAWSSADELLAEFADEISAADSKQYPNCSECGAANHDHDGGGHFTECSQFTADKGQT